LLQCALALLLTWGSWSISFAQQVDAAASEDWVLRQYRDPGSGEMVEIRAPRSTAEALRPFKPSNLRQDSRFVSIMRGAAQQGRDLMKAFPPETAMFLAAGGLVATRQLLTQGDLYPMALAHFISYQVADPLNHASFAFFILANRGANSVFDAAATRFGLMRDEVAFSRMIQQIARDLPAPAGFADDFKRGFVGARASSLEHFDRILARAEAIAPRPLGHGFASGLKAPLGIAAGVFASGLAYELLSDPDLQRCFGSWFKSPRLLAVEINEGQKAPFVACDHAYDRWVSTGMLMKQLPNMASVVASFLTQSFVINPILAKSAVLTEAGARRFIPVLFRGIQLGRAFGSTHPAGRLLILVGHTYLFLELNHFYTPIMNRMINLPRVAGQIAQSERRLLTRAGQGWLEPACRAKLESFVRQRVASGAEAVELDKVEYSHLANWLRQNAADCGEIGPAPSEALRAHMALATEWRQLGLAQANERLQQWSDLVQGLVAAHQSSYQFYRKMIETINSAEGQRQLDQEAPFYRLGVSTADRFGDGAVDGPDNERAVGAQLADILIESRRLMRLEAHEYSGIVGLRSSLEPVVNLWEAIDPNEPLQPIHQAALRDLIIRDPSQAARTEDRYRQAVFVRGLMLFQEKRRSDDILRVAIGDTQRQGVAWRLSQLVGEAQPLGPGRLFLKSLELDPMINVPAARAHMTAGFGRAATPGLIEHHLATAICGPADVLSQWPGFGIRFTAPRLVDSSLRSPCDRVPSNLSPDRALFSIHDGIFNLDGTPVRGFLAVLRRFLRPEFRGPNALANFDRFWRENVDQQMVSLERDLMRRYDGLLSAQFQPVFTSLDLHRETRSRAVLFSRSLGTFPSLQDDVRFLQRLLDSASDPRFKGALTGVARRLQLMAEALISTGRLELSSETADKVRALVILSAPGARPDALSVNELKPFVLSVYRFELAEELAALRQGLLASQGAVEGEMVSAVATAVDQLAEAIESAASMYLTPEIAQAARRQRGESQPPGH
jgi:hypothetical protein